MTKTRVHTTIDETGAIVMPGVYDTLSARIAARLGFRLAFISGYSVAATDIGEPDLGLLTQTEMLERARNVCGSVDMPILVDADTGYGNPLNVIRTVEKLVQAGAAGCFLEDQVWPKRCGHMHGKRVVDRDEYVQKIRAAADARAGEDFFIVARTDALAPIGLEEAIARMKAARDAGADACFVEAPTDRTTLEEVGRRVPKPLVANMIEGGRTPILPKKELEAIGYELILYPLSGLLAAARALERIYAKLLRDETTLGQHDELMLFDALNELIGVEEKYAIAERYGEKT